MKRLLARAYLWLIARDLCPCNYGGARLCLWFEDKLIIALRTGAA